MDYSLFFIADHSIYEVNKKAGDWMILEKNHPYAFHSMALDPNRKDRLYLGTFDDGLFISDDRGETLASAGSGIEHKRILSLATSKDELGQTIVWAGTEPSELFCSKDSGNTWTHFPELSNLPSHPSWSFPPRPYTHHVRSIQIDPQDPEKIFAGIELGGVMRSLDGGKSWEDRKEGSQYDCHSLTMNPLAEDRIYEAAGGGFAQSKDGGETWSTINDGLGDYTYLVDMATDSGDPDIIIASAAKSARTAYAPESAHTVLVRKEGDRPWEVIRKGLPEAKGSSIFSLTSRQEEPGVFYAVNNLGLYHSTDKGLSWKKLPLNWPGNLTGKRIRALVSS